MLWLTHKCHYFTDSATHSRLMPLNPHKFSEHLWKSMENNEKLNHFNGKSLSMFLMSFQRFLWIYMDFHRFSFIFTDFHGSPSTSHEFPSDFKYGFPLISMRIILIFCVPRISLDFLRFSKNLRRVSTDFHGCLQIRIDLFCPISKDFPWNSIDFHYSQWISIRFQRMSMDF